MTEIKVRKGQRARPTVPHRDRKRAAKRGERKHKGGRGHEHNQH